MAALIVADYHTLLYSLLSVSTREQCSHNQRPSLNNVFYSGTNLELPLHRTSAPLSSSLPPVTCLFFAGLLSWHTSLWGVGRHECLWLDCNY